MVLLDKVTIAELQRRKRAGEKLTMLTAYDYPMAKLVDEAGVDIVLVGDSLGMVVLGYDSTAPVTMEEMLHHAKAARRGVSRAMLIGDMPLLSLQGTAEESVKNAARFIHEAGCEAIKLEWKPNIEQAARAMANAGIPVMGHVGLTPQTAAGEGGYGVRGKDAESAVRILGQAVALQEAGCFAMVLECVPDVVAQEITIRLQIPTFGIGSGPYCNGQVLVTYDLIGLYDRLRPRFVKRYADVAPMIRQAAAAYVQEVRSGTFPGKEQTTAMAPTELAKFRHEVSSRRAS